MFTQFSKQRPRWSRLFRTAVLGCLPSLAIAGPPAESFPIDRIYSLSKVRLTSDGVAVFSKASKAFILWRQRTPPWIADEVFSMHYLPEDAYECLFQISRVEKGKPANNAKLADLHRQGLVEVQDQVRETAAAIGSETLFKKYIALNIAGEVRFFLSEKGTRTANHAKMQKMLLEVFPDAPTVGAGDVRIEIRVDTARKVWRVDFTLINVDAWVSGKTPFDDLAGAFKTRVLSGLGEDLPSAKVDGYCINTP